MELKRYVLLPNNQILDFQCEDLKDTDKNVPEMFENKVIDTSDNILDLAREGDLVRQFDNLVPYLLVKDSYGHYGFIDSLGSIFLLNNEQDISILYKKVGNNYIGYEVK